MKFKRLAAVSLAAAMAITSSIVCQIGASAAETELSTTSISVTDLEKYDSLKVTYAPQLVGDCGHSHDAGITNCPWAQVAFIATEVDGIAADISDSKKSSWYQPDNDNLVTAATWTDAAECTATVKVSDILASFTSDKDWSSDYTLKTISLQGWQCSVTKVIGVSADSTGTPDTRGDFVVTLGEDSSWTFIKTTNSKGEAEASINIPVWPEGMAQDTTTLGELQSAYKNYIISNFKYVSNSMGDLFDENDFHVQLIYMSSTSWDWQSTGDTVLSKTGTTLTWNTDLITGDSANKINVLGYQIYISSDKLADLEDLTKIVLNPQTPDETSDYDTQQSEQVKDYGTDTTKELHVMSITPKDAAKYSGYKITVTLSNGKTLTKTTTDCYKSFKYTNSKGDSTTETSADNYFIIVRIINIPDGVTVSSVTFTPVE